MTKYFLAIILTLSFFPAKSQEQDYRARLQVSGGVDKISVGFDESIWLGTRTGELYSTRDFDEGWHYNNVIEKDANGISFDKFYEVVKFNQDTILIVGEISKGGGYNPNSVVLSKNGGRTWKVIKFTDQGTTQIHAIDYNYDGEVWISGGPAKFYYSRNFGQNWTEKTSPYTGSSRVYSIDMIDSKTGAICSQANKISITFDNCETWLNLETPFNQIQYNRPDKRWEYTKVEKVEFFGKYLIAKQWNKVFFTEIKDIKWSYLPHEIQEFSVDTKTGSLFTFSSNGQIVVFNTDLEETYRIDEDIIVKDLQAMNGKLFILDSENSIYRLEKQVLEKKFLFTTDHPIETPQIAKKANFRIWGVSGRDIYQADYQNSKWYRVKVLDFPVQDIMALNDNEVILWDGISKNFYYNSVNDSISLYRFNTPIQDFLKHDITKITVNGGSQGCFHSRSSTISFIPNEQNEFILNAEEIAKSELGLFAKTKSFSYSRIKEILTSINEDPYRQIAIKDFDISEDDKAAYSRLIKKKSKDLKTGRDFENRNFDLSYFDDAINHLDTISNASVNGLLEEPEKIWSTTTNWFTVTFTNSRNEDLVFEHQYYLSPKAWFLPWHLKYDNSNLISKSLAFSRLINEMIPDNFMFKEVFSNKELLFLLVEDQYSRSDKNIANTTVK